LIPHPGTRDEVAAVLDWLDSELDALELIHAQEQDELDPNLWTVVAHDASGYINLGFVGWSVPLARVVFVGYDPLIAHHDEAEGIEDDDSCCRWEMPDADTMLMHLSGTVRDIVADHRRMILESA
jgi:hypothetical protein